MTQKKKHPVNLCYKHINEVLTDMLRAAMPGVTPQSADLYYHDEVIVAPMVYYTDEQLSGYQHCMLLRRAGAATAGYGPLTQHTPAIIITDTPRPDEYYLAGA